MEIFKSNKEKKITYLVFGIYLIFLCWLVLFKCAISIEDIPHFRGVNLIPFYYNNENSVHLKEVVYNIVVFIPAGFYFTALFGKEKKLTGVFITAILSLLFEITQWIFSIGASDITDLITNTLGGICGLFLFILMGKISYSRRMGIANLIGIVIELLGGGILVLLLIAN